MQPYLLIQQEGLSPERLADAARGAIERAQTDTTFAALRYFAASALHIRNVVPGAQLISFRVYRAAPGEKKIDIRAVWGDSGSVLWTAWGPGGGRFADENDFRLAEEYLARGLELNAADYLTQLQVDLYLLRVG